MHRSCVSYEVLRLVSYAFFRSLWARLPRLGFIGFRAGDVLGNLSLGLRVSQGSIEVAST